MKPGAFQRWVRGGQRALPHRRVGDFLRRGDAAAVPVAVFGFEFVPSRRVVAMQVAFERQILKAVFHMIGFRLWV